MHECADVRRAAVSSPRQAAAASQCLGERAARISRKGHHRPDRGNHTGGAEMNINSWEGRHPRRHKIINTAGAIDRRREGAKTVAAGREASWSAVAGGEQG